MILPLIFWFLLPLVTELQYGMKLYVEGVETIEADGTFAVLKGKGVMAFEKCRRKGEADIVLLRDDSITEPKEIEIDFSDILTSFAGVCSGKVVAPPHVHCRDAIC